MAAGGFYLLGARYLPVTMARSCACRVVPARARPRQSASGDRPIILRRRESGVELTGLEVEMHRVTNTRRSPKEPPRAHHTSPQTNGAVSAMLVALWAVASCASLRLSLWRDWGVVRVWPLDDTPAVTRLGVRRRVIKSSNDKCAVQYSPQYTVDHSDDLELLSKN